MLEKRVRELIRTQGLLEPGDSVLAGVSGGADSMALLHVLHGFSSEMGFTLAVAHLNHGLREGSGEEDALYVRRACEELGLACRQEKVDVRASASASRRSLEEAGRELRLQFLRRVAEEGVHNKIALGHTMDDQAETVLMRLIRGAGVLGASAMNPASGGLLIRPLLTTSRSEVLEFLGSRNIAYREDPSNLDTRFLRNRIRHELMATLREEYNPRITEVLCSHASLLGQVEDYLRLEGRKAYESCLIREAQEDIELELAALLSYHTCVRGYILREAYLRLHGSLRDLDFSHVASLLRLASSGQSGDSVDLPSGVSAWLEGKSVLLGLRSRRRAQNATPKFVVRLEPGTAAVVPEISLSIESKLLRKEELGDDFAEGGPLRAVFDFEGLEPPLEVRNLSPGDRIAPFGMEGTKKVQDLLVDMKVPRSRRGTLAALWDRNQILWVVGTRRARAAPVTDRTRTVLELRAVSGRRGSEHEGNE
ncbi:MAG: tRNA lysidine(34) synthetase TilS [Candidatus Eiseniibacteriota bacterium]|nr:MAG: tRNA lysidine(34) synthetase TilS [Candidatus Eisenbacteria bacterium]